jgi:hypothetical protein
MPAPQRLRCDKETGPTVAWENAADGGEQSAVRGFQLGAGGLPLEDGELMAQHQDLQVLGGVTASEQREELDGSAEREVDESGQHAHASVAGLGNWRTIPEPASKQQLTRHATVSAPYGMMIERHDQVQEVAASRSCGSMSSTTTGIGALWLEAPDRRAGLAVVGEDQPGEVRRRDLLGGLLHDYRPAA